MTYEEQIEHVLKHINIDIKTLKGLKEKEAALNELEFDAICLLKTILLYRGELWNKRNGEVKS